MMDKIFYYFLPLAGDYIKILAGGALLTAIIEALFFFAVSFKGKNFLLFVFFVNICSNVILNLYVGNSHYGAKTILTGELCVVAVEFLLYTMYLKEFALVKSFRLLLMTIFANLVSFSFGLIFLNTIIVL